MPLKLLAVIAAVVTLVGIMATRSTGAIDVTHSRWNCDKVASPLGLNSYAGTVAKPYETVERLANSLRPGQIGCLRAGLYERDVKVMKSGTGAAPITITSYPGERATVLGRFHVADEANNVVVQALDLDGRNGANLPSPTINGDNVVFRDNDVTNHHTSICFLLGSREYGRARGAVIERNHIHNCGQLPPTNHHHGIYVELSEGARITDNWIYDNADRGVQLFPEARGTYVARNVIDGNGQGVVFSRASADNIVEHNVISNPVVRYNVEDFELTGRGNIVRLNCFWSTRHPGNAAGIQPGIQVTLVENYVIDPGYANRDVKDFRLPSGLPCTNLSTGAPPQVAKLRKKRKRPVILQASASKLWAGGRLRLRASVIADGAVATSPKEAVLKVYRRGAWRLVGAMRLRTVTYTAGVRLARPKGKKRFRRFGRARIGPGARTLRLRVGVPGIGRSNIVLVQIPRR